ncbi:MAG: carbohydrate-binding family 9-like protein [Armatimonadetes bacterium]|nr:carbohydrate-binding family 9-like protein [Armatimonadota bacterium]
MRRWLQLTACMIAGLAATVAAAEGNLWSVPTVAAAPEARALLRPDAWPEASALTGFQGLASGELSRLQPVVWLGRDAARLYVGWCVPRVPGAPLAVPARKRDGSLWEDDSIEIFLDPGDSHREYYQFILNAAGAIFDGHVRDAAWNADCKVDTVSDDSAWSGILSLPFASLGTPPPADGAVWGFNVGFDRSPAQRPDAGWGSEEPNLTWSPLEATFHEPEGFGQVRFGSAVRLTSLGAPWWRRCSPKGGLARGTASVRLQREGGATSELGLHDGTPPAPLSPGRYQLALEARDGASTLARWNGRFTALAQLEPRLTTSAVAQTLDVDARYQDPQPPAHAGVAVSLRDARGKVVRAGRLELAGNRARAVLKWRYAELPAGAYVARLQDAGQPEILTEVSWTRPERPAWLGSKAGLGSDDVPLRPWTPLQVRSTRPLRLACWGREYAFGPSGLPAAVRSAGQELLAAPAAWDARVAGKAVAWQAEPLEVTHRSAGAVSFVARQTAPGLRLTTFGRLEFDGFLKLRVRLESTGAPVALSRLDLRVPFRRDIARLMHYFPKPSVWTGFNAAKINARAVPAAGWRSPFTYHVWVGDQARGLQWLTETDELWRPADPERAIELLPQGDRATLSLHVIGRPTRIAGRREYVFAFDASPVKPYPADWRHWHYAQVAWWGMETARHPALRKDCRVTWPALGNVRPDAGTLELTIVPQFDSTAKGELNRGLFYLVWPEDTKPEPDQGAWFYWNQDDHGMRVVFREGGKYTRVYGAPFAWKPGEAHTVAFTWGPEQAIYVDGQRLAAQPARGLCDAPVDLARAVLQIGDVNSDFTVRQIRISNAPRAVEALDRGGDPMQPDNATLLLDRLDTLRDRRSQPLRSAPGTFGDLDYGAVVTPGGIDISGPRESSTWLDYLKQVGVMTIGMHEHWADLQGFPRTSHTAELRSLVDGIHQRGQKLLLYGSWQLADIAPEYPDFHRECEVLAPDRFLYTRVPKQVDYPVCARSAWTDFMADGIDQLLRDYPIDGIYSDGLSYPGECSNGLHGCGYTGEDGQRHVTLNLFAVRDAMKRFRRLLDTQGRPMLFIAHTSGQITLPTLAFADAYLDAEHLTGQPRPFRLPLDAFQAEFMGHNFGIPAYFLVYDWNQGMTTPEGLALSLLHDVEVPWSWEQMAPVWQVWDRFGVDQAEFLPYWDPAAWFVSAPAGVKVSAYRKPDGDMLVVASNLGEQAVEGEIRLKARIQSAEDALTAEPLAVADGAVHGRFEPWQVKLIRVRTGG